MTTSCCWRAACWATTGRGGTVVMKNSRVAVSTSMAIVIAIVEAAVMKAVKASGNLMRVMLSMATMWKRMVMAMMEQRRWVTVWNPMVQ